MQNTSMDRGQIACPYSVTSHDINHGTAVLYPLLHLLRVTIPFVCLLKRLQYNNVQTMTYSVAYRQWLIRHGVGGTMLWSWLCISFMVPAFVRYQVRIYGFVQRIWSVL